MPGLGLISEVAYGNRMRTKRWTRIISRSLIPAKAKLDALHVASAAAGGVAYLLTQNCRHIANAIELPRVYELLEELGFHRLLICTPAEFLGDPEDGS